jgi:two-component system, NarL family, invasion response regulator UvrY
MKILIVDDHPIVRSGLRRLLAGSPEFEVREAASGKEALSIFRSYQPGLVVLDLSMPGIGGLEVIGRLKIEDAAVRILVLSVFHDAIYVTRALQAGAAGYMSKNAPPDLILEAIKRVAGGHSHIEHEIAQELALASIRAPGSPLEELSPRDFEILRLLGDGCSLRQIAGTIGVSYKTVANTCSQIKVKLRVERTADLVRIAIQNGISDRLR